MNRMRSQHEKRIGQAHEMLSKVEQLVDRFSAMQILQAQLENDKSNLLLKVETQSEKIVEQKKEIDDLERLASECETQAKQRRDLHEVLERENAQSQAALTRAQERIKILVLETEHLRRTLVERELQIDKMQGDINRRARDDTQKANSAQTEGETRTKNAEGERRKVEVAEARRRLLVMLAEEEQKRQAEKARQEREEAEQKARENEERERKERERKEKLRREQEWETATRNEEQRCKRRDETKWGDCRWTELRALERYRALMDEFERVKFSESQPLTVRSVPWPVLDDPFRFDPSDLEWGMVEQFFGKAKNLIGSEEYNQLIERSHRMFHPDRWKSRRLLQSVKNRVLRDTLERTGNIVSQAVTPLWKESRGRI